MNKKDYIDGLLLSDGYIGVHSSISGRYEQKCIKIEWLEIIRSYFCDFGIDSNITDPIISKQGFGYGSIYYHLLTKSYSYFKEMRERWYKKWYDIDNYPETIWHLDNDGEWFIWKKIIPKDIELTPECVANMYLGDGTIGSMNRGNGYQIFIYTYCFTRSNLEYLSNGLNSNIGIKSYITSFNTIGISSRKSVSEFLNYIKDYRVSCYDYKFPKELMR